MAKKTLVLKFPQQLINKPITYNLVKDYNLMINILKAKINPKEEGTLVLGIEGSDEKIKKGIKYIKKMGVKTQPLIQDVELNKDICTDCTYCITLCPTKSFFVDPDSNEVIMDKEKCIACGICVKACPYNAISLKLG